MNWQHFQTYNDAPTQAFETMCNQLFALWCKKTYLDSLKTVTIVNGSGGDGGVEAFAVTKDGTIIGMQAKWFLSSISTGQFGQISNSIETAIKIRPLMKHYIVCIPRDLASDRIGRGKKSIEDTELSRWQQLKNKFEIDNPSLEIELWNETQLLTRLQESDAAGIYRYWFEKSEISKELITYSYDKQKSGWLSQKYTPCLHIQGQMQKSILKFIGNSVERQNSIEKLNIMNQQCSKFLKACDDYSNFAQGYSPEEELIHEILKSHKQVSILLNEINFALEALNNEQQFTATIDENNWYIDFSMLINQLKKNEHLRENYFHISEIKKAIKKFQENEIYNIINEVHFQLDNKKYIILGEPGTGKTHGIANLVETLLNENSHIPILVRAKDINPQNDWLDIIKKTLGLASVWNEIELWQALEALSYRTEINNIPTGNTTTTKIIPKILICIEGVDESKPYDSWYERLREIEAICSQFPRLRFCITSRPYVFRNLAYDDSLLSNTLRLPSDGDVTVSVLFQDYINHFHVNVRGYPWIKWSLKTPLALRLFCENYERKKTLKIDKPSVTITNLLSHKFHVIEKEFNYKYETGYGNKELIIQNSLLVIARKLLISAAVYRSDLIDALNDVPGLINVTHDYRREVIDFVEDYGILQSYTVNTDNIFEIPKTYYSIGIQPIFDYILALMITYQIKDPSEVIITDSLVGQEGALQMVSILLLEDYGYLITENESFREKLSKSELFDLICFSLSNVSPKPTTKYLPLVKRIMETNSGCLKDVVNKIILPVSRIENHPLGTLMLHEHLMAYKTMGKRDIMWSAPSNLQSRGKASWKCYTKVNLADKRYKLCDEDKYDGVPLVYAWMLTTVNNIERVSYRRELLRWAFARPYEFYKLFELTCNTNDPQMKEDLFALVMGTVFILRKGDPCIKLFGDWMIKNIFAADKISLNYNCAIRYYSRAIVERAYVFDKIKYEDLEMSRPPYKTTGIIPLNYEATAGTRMSGYRPITYDLARYVLCDPIDNMFFSRRGNDEMDDEIDYSQYFSEEEIGEILTDEHLILNERCSAELKSIQSAHERQMEFWDHIDSLIANEKTIESHSKTSYRYNGEADEFLSDHAHILEMELLESNQFVISAAYAYILLQGWNEEEFYGHPNGDKQGEIIGVDVAIIRQHHAASHGTKSSIMSLCEKYTWCARNEILGYLSDRLPFRNFERMPSLLNDYGLLDDFPNPAQELYQEDPDSLMERTSWFIPEELSPLVCKNMGEDAIKDWIINAPIPNFEKWIDVHCFNREMIQEEEKKDWITFYSYNSVSNAIGGESLLWISSAIISKKHFTYLKNDIMKHKEFLVHELSNPEDLYSCTETQCYLTPKEICWMNWKNDCYNKIPVVSIDINSGDFVNYTVEKAVEECTANYPEFGDVYYKLPSRIIREMLNICDGDGYKYYDEEKQLKAIAFEAGEKWYDSQSYLCVDKEKLLLQLEHHNYQLVWIVRLLREATSKSLEKYPKLHTRSDRCWLIWYEDGIFGTQQFFEQID